MMVKVVDVKKFVLEVDDTPTKSRPENPGNWLEHFIVSPENRP